MTVTITWGIVMSIIGLFISWSGLLFGLIKWFSGREIVALDARIKSAKNEAGMAKASLAAHREEYLKFLADLPLSYYRKEDWIRFETTMHLKLDAVAKEIKSLECRKCQLST